jgi:cholesterol transport system auxiliary component
MHTKPQVTPVSIAAHVHSTLGKAGFLLIFAVLGGCAVLPDKPVRPAVYDFGPGPGLTAASAKTTPVAAPPAAALPALSLGDIDAPPAIDGSAVLFRLAYADVQQLRPYAQARWSMPPAQLVRQRLREQLSQQRVVLNPGEGAAPFSLRLEREEDTQVFETPERSFGLVRLRATLVEATGGRERLVAQRRFVTQRPAPSADAAGGVRALSAATDAAIDEIAQWLQQLPVPVR